MDDRLWIFLLLSGFGGLQLGLWAFLLVPMVC